MIKEVQGRRDDIIKTSLFQKYNFLSIFFAVSKIISIFAP